MAVNEKTANSREFAEIKQKMAFAKNIHTPNCFLKISYPPKGLFSWICTSK